MKRFVTIAALACALFGSAFAGDMPTGGYAPPPPDTTHITSVPAAPAEVPSGGYTQDAATDITLTAVQAIIGLLSI